MKTQFAFYAHAKANDLTFGLQNDSEWSRCYILANKVGSFC